MGCNIKILLRLRLAIDWFASSGKPYTLYISSTPYSPPEINGNIFVEQISQEYELRLPNVHELTAMFSTHWKWGSVQNNFNFGVQNIYNKRNIILEDAGIRSQQGFPILPMILWRVSF